jgi:hypothetical protein
MKKILKSLLIIKGIILAVILCSCNNFLEVIPKSQISDATMWADKNAAELFLNNAYSGLPNPFNTSDPIENYSDNSMNGINGQVSRDLVANAVYTPSNTPNEWGNYNNIRKCNLFIENVTKTKLPDDWKKIRIGEARFLRAYYYMRLWTWHGGVPIITDVLDYNTQGEEIFRIRNTSAETFQFIINECEAIVNDLPLNSDAGRVTRGAVLTLEGWCKLFWASPLNNSDNDKKRWMDAADANKRVIDLGIYALFPDYNNMFFEENNNNKEVIFAKQYLGGTPIGGSREGYQGPWKVAGIQKSWGGVDPTQELVDEYCMSNGLPISDPKSGYNPQNPYENREKRFYQSIVYDGSEWLGSVMVMKQGVQSPNATDLSNNNEATNTGYYLRKGLNPKYCINGPNLLNSASFIIYRYAEVLLSFSEAQNEAIGPVASVYDAINQLRNRSNLPPLQAGMTQAEMRAAIYRERRVELAFEDKRWFDLIRLKQAENKLNGKLHAMQIEQVDGKWVYKVIIAPAGSRTFYSTKNYVFPIPQGAMDRNTKLTQNPNY